MKDSVFNPEEQQRNLSGKIISGLERVSQAFKVLLWNKAKALGLSPIQIQLLIFISYHKNDLNNVSFLAQEFNVTKPTISDAVKVLDKKGLIIKEYSSADSRSYSIYPSEKGKEIVVQTDDFALPLLESIEGIDEKQQSDFFQTLTHLIFQLNRKGILTVQRSCHSCRFYRGGTGSHYCNLLEKVLQQTDIRLDCPEYESSI